MSFVERFQEAVEWIASGVKKILDWAGSEQTLKAVEGLLSVATLLAKFIENVRSQPLSGAEKARAIRLFIDITRYADPEELYLVMCEIGRLKNTGELDELKGYELDTIIGAAITNFLTQQATEEVEEDGLIDY